MTDYAAVLRRRHAGREWKLEGDDYAGLTMLDGGEKPTQASLDDLWPQVKAEIETAAATKVAALISARAKLAALGLSEAEVAALLGG